MAIAVDRGITPQWKSAIDAANAVRLARAAMLRKIAEGMEDVRDVIDDPPDYALTLPLITLLKAQHRWGTTRSKRNLNILTHFDPPVIIGERRPLGELTRRQRDALIELLS